MDYKLELVLVPVSDVDRPKEFYVERAGFSLDVDYSAGDEFRVVRNAPISPDRPVPSPLVKSLSDADQGLGVPISRAPSEFAHR